VNAEFCFVSGDKIVAMGLLTQNDLSRLGDTFKRVWPVKEVPSFEELLRAIDEADRGSRSRGQPCNG
jgi:hypothetical protein